MTREEYDAGMEKIRVAMKTRHKELPEEQKVEVSRLIRECSDWEHENIKLPEPSSMNGLFNLYMFEKKVGAHEMMMKIRKMLHYRYSEELILKCLNAEV